MSWTSIDELMGSHPAAAREDPLPVRRAMIPMRRYREGCNPEKMLGAFSLDSIAAGVGTDTKTLLLIGGGALLAGWLLNDAVRSVKKTVHGVKRAISGAKRKAGTPLFSVPGIDVTPMKIALIAAVIGGYWYYEHHQRAAQSAPPQGPQA